MLDNKFLVKLSPTEREAWQCFIDVVNGFLGNHKVENYKEAMPRLIDTYQQMGCRMSLKLHVLHSHLEVFKSNMGAYFEEQGERFHQDVKEFDKRYQGQYNERMLGDYVWELIRESGLSYKRKSRNLCTSSI